jgi:hypothetical protein
MLNVSPDPAPSLQSPNPAHRHTAAVRPPRGAQWAPRACARERRPAFGSRRRCALGRTRPVTGDTTPYDKRPAELHNPRITQATYVDMGIRPSCRAPLSCGNRPTLPGAGAVWKSAHLAGAAAVWESAHLAGRRCCGNPPTLPGAAVVWESAHLAARRCCVGIGPLAGRRCRGNRPTLPAPLPCGNPPTLPGAVVWESAHLAGCVIASDLTTHLHFTW